MSSNKRPHIYMVHSSMRRILNVAWKRHGRDMIPLITKHGINNRTLDLSICMCLITWTLTPGTFDSKAYNSVLFVQPCVWSMTWLAYRLVVLTIGSFGRHHQTYKCVELISKLLLVWQFNNISRYMAEMMIIIETGVSKETNKSS